MRVKMRVTQHRAHHDGSIIVRLESADAVLKTPLVLELHPSDANELKALFAPVDEESEVFVRQVGDKGVIDRRVKTPAKPGADVTVDINAV